MGERKAAKVGRKILKQVGSQMGTSLRPKDGQKKWACEDGYYWQPNMIWNAIIIWYEASAQYKNFLQFKSSLAWSKGRFIPLDCHICSVLQQEKRRCGEYQSWKHTVMDTVGTVFHTPKFDAQPCWTLSNAGRKPLFFTTINPQSKQQFPAKWMLQQSLPQNHQTIHPI